MRILNFLLIALVSLAMSAYSVRVSALRNGSTEYRWYARRGSADPVPLVTLKEAKALWDEGKVVFVDVRNAADYSFGHIDGAINIPEQTFAETFPEYRSRLQQAQHIIVYCQSRDCGKSLWAALRLRQQGLLQTRIYPHGWNEWTERGMPITGQSDF
jgi:rhodanese-related sulfurtransferase